MQSPRSTGGYNEGKSVAGYHLPRGVTISESHTEGPMRLCTRAQHLGGPARPRPPGLLGATSSFCKANPERGSTRRGAEGCGPRLVRAKVVWRGDRRRSAPTQVSAVSLRPKKDMSGACPGTPLGPMSPAGRRKGSRGDPGSERNASGPALPRLEEWGGHVAGRPPAPAV